jgi:hypothetical protein
VAPKIPPAKKIKLMYMSRGRNYSKLFASDDGPAAAFEREMDGSRCESRVSGERERERERERKRRLPTAATAAAIY